MARRDVDLVIRARDQAKGAITSITQALEGFVQVQGDVNRVAADTDGTLDRLGQSLSRLNTAFGGLGAAAAAANQLSRAEEQLRGLATSTAAARDEALRYSLAAANAGNAAGKLATESQRLGDAVQKQRTAVAGAVDAQNRLTRATQSANQERRRLAEADNRLNAQIEEQRLRLALASAAFGDLQSRIGQTEQPTKRLEQQFQSVGRAVRQAEERLEGLQTTQAVVRASIDATARSVERANTTYGSQARSVERQVAALERLERQQREVSGALDSAVSNQTRLESESRKAASSLERQSTALARAEQNYAELSLAASGVRVALEGVADAQRGPLLRSFAQQAERVSSLRAEYERTSAEATRLGRSISRLGSEASEDIVADFTRQQQAAALARQAYREQQQALGSLRQVLRETGGDLNEFANRQNRFQATLRSANAAYSQYGAATREAAVAQARQADEARRAAEQAERLESATRRQGQAATTAARQTTTLAGAVRQFYGESRTALSFTQRLRGEVLSLIAAYGGFFAVIEGVRGVIGAYQTLEAAQSRLNAVFDGDQTAVVNELDFLRRNAERLGIEFGVLSDTYTKFAAATKGTNLEGEETRRIFVAVAEAARVNKLGIDQVNGVFRALEQIVSKGTVQMEELRQQLGDRLPGATQIFADGLGISVAELQKLTEQGALSSDSLSAFATELDRRFGSQLPAALETTTTAIGAFQNAVFQALLSIGNGGFIEAFTRLLQDLTDSLNSDQFESFASRVSILLANLTDVVGFAARNWDLLITAVTAFIGLKIAPFVVLLASRMGVLTGATVSSARGFRALQASIAAGTVSMVSLTTAARTATIALRGLLSTTGIGLAVVAIGAAIGSWATSTEQASEALNEHQRILQAVRDAYDRTSGAVDDWREAINEVTRTQARTNLQSLQRQLEDAREAFENAIPTNIFGGVTSAGGGFFQEVSALFEQFEDGAFGVDEFVARLDELNEQYRDLFPVNAEFAATFDELARAIREANKPVEEARDILTALEGPTSEAQQALDRTSGAVREVGRTAEDEARRIENLSAAFDRLDSFLPELKDNLEQVKEAANLEEAYQNALRYVDSIEEAQKALEKYQAAQRALELDNAFDVFEGATGNGQALSAQLIRQFEGFVSNATPDFTSRNGQRVNSGLRAGFGSDTVTLADGSVKQVVEGITVTMADAQRDLVRRVFEFQDVIREQIGGTRFESFAPEQQAALTSIAYNYGRLPARIVEAVRGGTTEQIAEAIRGLSGDNDGLNRSRRNQEATIFQAGGPIREDAEIDAVRREREEQEKAAERAARDAEREAQRRAEELQRAREATEERISDGEFEVRQQALKNDGLDRQAAIEAALREARKENNEISQQQLDLIGQQTAQLFDQQNPQFALNQQKEKAEKAEQRVNDLLSLRGELLNQLRFALEQGGETEATEALRESISGVNTELGTAVEKAIELFEVIAAGNPDIQATVERLRLVGITASQSAQSTVLDWERVRNQFSTGLTNAVDSFFQGLSEGKSITDSLRDSFLSFAADFLREIARMILQQAILNSLRSAFGGFSIPGFGGGVPVGVSHSGGLVGSRTAARRVDPAAFAAAMRYHSGGIAGLRPGEVPTILERNEEVLTTSNPRHIFNQSGTGSDSSGVAPNVYVGIDGPGLLEEALDNPRGGEAQIRWIGRNAEAIKGALGQ